MAMLVNSLNGITNSSRHIAFTYSFANKKYLNFYQVSYRLESSSSAHPKIGVLLTNVGTPEKYTYWNVRDFLSQFLSDSRVIELPKFLWKPILELFVLSSRTQRISREYKKIWNERLNEFPLKTITRNQAGLVRKRFIDEKIEIDWAFRYGSPSIHSRIQFLKEKGCDRLIVFPLFPQYSAATTGTINDEVFRILTKQRSQMAIRTVPAFYNNDIYIKTIANSITITINESGIKPDMIIFSYHGLPMRYHYLGDPYGLQCIETTKLIRQHLPADYEVMTSFQSRLGPIEWLKPYTDESIINCAKNGMKNIAVVAPGFISDCLETLLELEKEASEIFRKNGGDTFLYVPCVNDSDLGINILEEIIREHVQGFI